MKNTICLAILFSATQALACKVPIATSTMYYTPDAKEICGKYYASNQTPCEDFREDSKMQGSGILSPGTLYRSTGAVDKLEDNCKTTTGYAGTCLIPYISIAADARYHHMGDYISMPALKNKKVTLADGRVLLHPGYLRVDDTGGAIKGTNRFDFYTGGLGLFDKKNSFGHDAPADTKMSDKTSCPARKTYAHVSTSKEKAIAKAAIETFEKAYNTVAVSVKAKTTTAPVKKTKSSGGQN